MAELRDDLLLMPRASRAISEARAMTDAARCSAAAALVCALADGDGVAAIALASLGLDGDSCRSVRLHETFEAGAGGSIDVLVSAAHDEAVALDHNYVGTEHLLLAVLRNDAIAASLQRVIGDVRLLRAAVWRVLLDLAPGGWFEPEEPAVAWAAIAPAIETSFQVDGSRHAAVLRRHMDRLLTSEPLVGLVLGVGREGELIATATAGLCDASRAEAITRDTFFSIGSITKVVTGLAVLRLHESGVLALNRPANRYLSEIRVASLDGEEITIAELLTHTSGLGAGHGLRHDPATPGPPITSAVGPVVTAEHPRGEWNYSNIAFWVLGSIIEAITGSPWSEAVHDLVLDTAGMATMVSGPVVVGNRVRGHTLRAAEIVRIRPTGVSAAPAGALWSRSEDLIRLGHLVLNPESVIGCTRDTISGISVSTGRRRRQAIALLVDPHTGWLSHEGSWPGLESAVLIDPSSGNTVTALANTTTGRLRALVGAVMKDVVL